MKTQRERREEQRQEKLKQIAEDVESGSLVIRKMSAAEREQYPVREPRPKRRRW